jgi:membrane protein DedA with SNARE-associated domain
MTHVITSAIVHHGYLAIFLLMLLESACIPIPSEAIMLFGGALAGGLSVAGATSDVTIWEVTLVGTLGNVVGSLIAYGIGRYGGEAVLQRKPASLLIRAGHLRASERFFAQHGDSAVLLGRVLPVIRTFVSLPAGFARIPVGRFTVLTTAGCIPWTLALTIAGYYLADRWDSVASGFAPVSIGVGVVVIVAVGWAWHRVNVRSRSGGADADAGVPLDPA